MAYSIDEETKKKIKKLEKQKIPTMEELKMQQEELKKKEKDMKKLLKKK
ncbi:MAG: hypothetical protein KKF44_00810 [Nanoarchaeota archaeon]|nr:hypothetical protein [Nanoarchaeota archaeon]